MTLGAGVSPRHIPRMTDTDTKTQPTAPESIPGGDGARPSPARNIQKDGEIGGAKGPEPTRYGDWEHGGRCTDF